MRLKTKINSFMKIILLSVLLFTIIIADAILKTNNSLNDSINNVHEEKEDFSRFEDDQGHKIEQELTFLNFDDDIFEKGSEISFSESPDTSYKIIFEDGTVQDSMQNVEINIGHIHAFKKINIKEYNKNEDGSISVVTYAGKKCAICGYEYMGDVISENIYYPWGQ